jgi:hypothetical protein
MSFWLQHQMPQVFVGNEKGRHIVKTIIQQRFSGQHTV